MLKSIPGIGSNEADSIFKEIMYGQSQSKRSDKCFIFMLDDKTNFEEEEEKLDGTTTHSPEEDLGVIPGRLYGICVVHSRIINSNVNDPTADNQDKVNSTSNTYTNTNTNSDQKDNDLSLIHI